MNKRIFVTGIGTGVGKTIVSTLLTEALEADYWKPVQCGSLESTDTDFVRKHISNLKSVCHNEQHRLKAPVSPHLAAQLEDVTLNMCEFEIPETSNPLIIEGAGGLMVPLNDRQLVIDLAKKFNAAIIVVSQHYLGSINHTLLTLEYLRSNDFAVNSIIYSGNPNEETEKIVSSFSTVPNVVNIPFGEIDKNWIREQSIKIRQQNFF